MSEQAKSEDKSSHTTSGIAIIAILLSMFAVQDTILKPTRPPMVNTERAFGEDARSRLWQDPFQAVEEHRKYQQAQENPSRPISEFEATIDTTHSQRQKYKIISETKGSKHVVIEMPSLDENYAYEYGHEPTRVCFDKAEKKTRAPDGYSASKAIAHSFDELHCEMEKETKSSDSRNVHVLAVMVPGGPYAEDKERRLRSRYAVISALAEHDYASTDPEHIDFLDFEATCKAMLREERADKLRGMESSNKEGFHICELPDFMPYEWFRPIHGGSNNDRAQRILLLWLDNDAFARSEYPLNLLGFLKKEIYKIQEKEKIKLDFSVIGPHGSDLLYKMYREASDNHIISFNQNYKLLTNTPIYTATATIRPSHLPKIDPTGWLSDDMISFTRTVSTQNKTVEALFCELMLRGINPFSESNSKIKEHCIPEIRSEIPQKKYEQSHIVLLGEKDNRYAQMLTETFKEISLGDSKSKSDRDIKKIHFFNYLRGLDGITSEQPSASQETKNRSGESQENKSAEIKEQRERPVGTSQLDYLVSLVGQIKQLDREHAKDGGIKAIGITGTDTYDKLLVLQALRPKFPGVIFFTTDLDARLFHPSEIKWTRNLIVASPFGLKLSEKVQPRTPPFRDNFQTSTFLSARLALCAGAVEDLHTGCNVINREKENWTKHPRVFEIGNYGAVDISHNYAEGSIFTEPEMLRLKKEASKLLDINDETEGVRAVDIIEVKNFIAVVIIIFFITFFVPRDFRVGLVLITSVPIALIICSIFIASSDNLGGEPISLINGVSSWIGIGIKIFAILLSLCLLWIMHNQLKRNRKETEEKFWVLGGKAKDVTQSGASFERVVCDTFFEPGLFLKLRTGYVNLTIDPWNIKSTSLHFKNIWSKYLILNSISYTVARTLIAFVIIAIALGFLYVPLSYQYEIEKVIFSSPFRGSNNYIFNIIITVTAVGLNFLLILIVAHSTHLSSHFVKLLADRTICWPDELRRSYQNKYSLIDRKVIECRILLDFIKHHTDAPNKFIYYPFFVLFLIILSRNYYFDNWQTSSFLLFCYVILIITTLTSAFRLRAAAQYAKAKILERLESNEAQAPVNQRWYKRDDKAAKFKLLVNEIREFKEGVYKPLAHHPAVLYLLLPLSSLASVYLIEYLN